MATFVLEVVSYHLPFYQCLADEDGVNCFEKYGDIFWKCRGEGV